jgi:hypothetical protein
MRAEDLPENMPADGETLTVDGKLLGRVSGAIVLEGNRLMQ